MRRKDFTHFLIWELVILAAILAVIGGGLYLDANFIGSPNAEVEAAAPVTLLPTHSPTPSPTAVVLLKPTATSLPQPPAAGLVAVDAADQRVVKWSTADEAPLSDSYLYMVLRDGTVYHGPMQFDVSIAPPGSIIFMTELLEQGSTTETNFALNILPAGNRLPQLPASASRSDAAFPAVVEAALTSGNQAEQLIFKAGDRAAVEARLQASQLSSFSLNRLFPQGQFSPAGAAFLSGSAQLPLPPNDATLEPDRTPTATATMVMVTSTPTPENILTVAAQAPTATYQATATGTPTAIPENWVTPWVVTSTPTPQNQATARFQLAEATAIAVVYGTPEPPPLNMVTATPKPTETPTPVFILLEGELPPPTPVLTPVAPLAPTPPIPAQLIGKIAFKSDRTGQEEIYVINPDGSGLALLTGRWPYHLARLADPFSADGRFRIFTKDMVRYKNISDPLTDEIVGAKRVDAPALYWYDSLYQAEELLTHFGAGMAYDGVWSPSREQIAFVSNDSGNDEIWVVNRDGSDLRQLTRDDFNWWDKHPSWSPDGNQIVFWSNRTGHGQIWVMDADGNNLYSLSRTGFNDWDPVWLKYPGFPGNAQQIHLPYSGPYDPAGADRSCTDFATPAEAQAFYLAAGGPYLDAHRLDRDNDGMACEWSQ